MPPAAAVGAWLLAGCLLAAWVLTAGLLATTNAWGQGAGAVDHVDLPRLVADPARYDSGEVVVEGIAGASQWLHLTVLGNPNTQGWFPAFLFSDGPAIVWVVVRYMGVGPDRITNLTAPPPGERVRIRGIYRAPARTIEMTQPFVVVR